MSSHFWIRHFHPEAYRRGGGGLLKYCKNLWCIKHAYIFKKNYLVYFENKLSYSECIVRGAQKGCITREFLKDPQLKGPPDKIKYA